MSEVRRWAHMIEWEGMQMAAAYMAINDGGEYVMHDDYAALEAENARLQSAFDELAERYGKLQAGEDSLLAKVVTERDTACAQLAAIQGGMGEVVGFDRNVAYAACPESGCDWGSFYVGWKAAAAQHQRITAAMAAEVATWRSNAVMLEQANAGLAQLNGKLRAELAAVKGREAACFVVGKLEKTAVIDSPLPVGTKLYTTPPASPDVEGLVKALELWLADYDDVAANPDFEPHPHVAERVTKSRTALSTWRQAQEGKP